MGIEPKLIRSYRLIFLVRDYSRQSVQTGLTPANALSVCWCDPQKELPHFRKISRSSLDNVLSLYVKELLCFFYLTASSFASHYLQHL